MGIIYFFLNWISVIIIAYLEKRYCGSSLKERYERCRTNIFKYIFKQYNLFEGIFIIICITLFGILITIISLLDFINSIKIDNKKIKVGYNRTKATYTHIAKNGTLTEEVYTYYFDTYTLL